MKKVGIITFHNSYNCGSMMESFALQYTLTKFGVTNEIIDFSNKAQLELYSTFHKVKGIKDILRNILIFPYRKNINRNNEKYREFQKNFLILSTPRKSTIEDLSDDNYSVVISGSDQVWNITLEDGDDAYFLPWVKNARKVAYAPSFGSKNIVKFANDVEKYKTYISDFKALSIRENNGKLWLKELVNKEVPVLLDPTLLLKREDYLPLIATDIEENDKYIFFYSPGYDVGICKFVKEVSKKYGYKVISWSEKNYRKKIIQRFGFNLPKYENPSSYLYYIQNAELVFTTSFHGTIFSALFEKKFYILKNGGMYGDDDRVRTLVESLALEDRLITYDFDKSFNYLSEVNYTTFFDKLEINKVKSLDYIKKEIVDYYVQNV